MNLRTTRNRYSIHLRILSESIRDFFQGNVTFHLPFSPLSPPYYTTRNAT